VALRELLLPWDAQPQEAVRPSDQFDGLSTLVTLWGLRDAARSESVAVTGTRLTVTRWGLARGFGSTLGGGTTDRVQTSATARQRQTFVVVGVRNGPGGGGYGRYFQSGTTGIAPCEVLFNSNEGTTVFQRLSGNIARFTWAYPDIGVPFCTVISYDASAAGWKPTVATNGVAQSVTPTSPPTSAGGNVTGAIIVGNREAGDRVWDGHWLLFAEIDRACSRSECIDLSANPWQLFEPRRIFVPVSVGGGGSWSVSLTESASASDSLGAATTALVSLIESASAADIITAATIAAVALTEAASASDTQTASYSVTGSGSVTESASATDTLDAANTMLRALTETASADDQLAAATTMLRAISESASASDDASASYTAAGAAAITETASATDALTAAATLLVTILEAGSATDALAAATTMVRAITEQAVAADEVAASQPIIASVSITELATAIDVLIGELAGGAWVAGDGLMSKPRIGMARNGDLYSLVLDDDGVPVACKRMGTSRLLKLRALPGGNQAQVMVETGVVLVVL